MHNQLPSVLLLYADSEVLLRVAKRGDEAPYSSASVGDEDHPYCLDGEWQFLERHYECWKKKMKGQSYRGAISGLTTGHCVCEGAEVHERVGGGVSLRAVYHRLPFTTRVRLMVDFDRKHD